MSGNAKSTPSALRKVLRTQFTDGEGPASAEKVLERLQESYRSASRESNWLFAGSLLVTGFYALKVLGLRVDVVLMDQRIFELPYGIFLFCILSQVCFIAACFRFLDARSFDRYIRAICEKQWPASADLMHMSYIGAYEWLSPTQDLIERGETSIGVKAINILTTLLVILIVISVLCLPVASGIYFISDWKRQISGGWINLQYWSVLTTTTITALTIALTVTFYTIDNEETKGDL